MIKLEERSTCRNTNTIKITNTCAHNNSDINRWGGEVHKATPIGLRIFLISSHGKAMLTVLTLN